MFCENCGAVLQGLNQEFCHKCGIPLRMEIKRFLQSIYSHDIVGNVVNL
ncbi:hypothetical protein LCGC14_2031110 [marine sediment metagenome]|uniref:Zinc-ribbon domain-containing protein n=1 Tax=marine sediment metagenome TaxID=412755 RepID=A0A0F9EUW5_9ZZZZ